MTCYGKWPTVIQRFYVSITGRGVTRIVKDLGHPNGGACSGKEWSWCKDANKLCFLKWAGVQDIW